MHGDAIHQHGIQAVERLGLVDLDRRRCRKRTAQTPGDHFAASEHERFTRGEAIDSGKGRVLSGGELELQQLDCGLRPELAAYQAGLQQCLWFGCEQHARRTFGEVKGLDAERIPGEIKRVLAPIAQSDRIHAAQRAGEILAIAPVGEKRQLAVGARREFLTFEFALQLQIIVDLAIGDEHRSLSAVERLISGLEIDDGKARLKKPDSGRHEAALAVGSSMVESTHHSIHHGRGRRRAVGGHHSGDAAHQRKPAMRGNFMGSM